MRGKRSYRTVGYHQLEDVTPVILGKGLRVVFDETIHLILVLELHEKIFPDEFLAMI